MSDAKRWVTALAVGALLAGAGTARAATPSYGTASDDAPPGCPATTTDCPTGDAFYTPPSDLASRPDGSLIASRPATVSGVQNLKAAYTVSFRSEDAFGAPVLGVATVMLPTAAYAGSGSTPLVSEQAPEDSLGSQCAPSYSLAHPNTDANVDADDSTLGGFLGSGYVVVMPDHEGPAGQYIVGQQEGHATLDGIRAAEALPATGLSSTTPVAITGYSGGAHATGWASELAASYAPGVRVVGVAEGGTPADLAAVGKNLDGSPFFGLSFLSVQALDRAFPATGISAALNAQGRTAKAASATDCVNDALAPYALKHYDDYTTSKDLMDTPPLKELLAHEQLGQAPPRVPILNYHVINDEIVPFAQDRTLVSTYCKARATVQFVPIAGDHISGAGIGAPLVTNFLRQRFSRATATNSCPTVMAGQIPPTQGSTGSSRVAAKPSATTDLAQQVTGRGALLRGTVKTHGLQVSYRFRLRSSARGSRARLTPARTIKAGLTHSQLVTARIVGLKAHRRYRFSLSITYRPAGGGRPVTRTAAARALRTKRP